MATTKKNRKKRPSVVGANLRRIREQLGMTQGELAERAGINRVNITELETGIRDNPGLVHLTRLSQALGVRVADLTEPEGAYSLEEPAIQRFLASPWGQAEPPTADELEWLRRRAPLMWPGTTPAPKALRLLLLAHRAAQAGE